MCLISWCVWSVDVFYQLMCLISWCVWSADLFDSLMCLISWCVWSVDVFYQLMCLISWFIWLVDVFDQLISWCIWSVDVFEWLMCLSGWCVWVVDVFDHLISLISWCVWSDDVFDQLMCLIDWCICILWIDVFGWLISLISRSCKINKNKNKSDLRFLYIFQVCEPVEQKVPKITCEKLKHWNLGKQKIKALKSHYFPILSFNFYTQRYLERTIILRNPN